MTLFPRIFSYFLILFLPILTYATSDHAVTFHIADSKPLNNSVELIHESRKLYLNEESLFKEGDIERAELTFSDGFGVNIYLTEKASKNISYQTRKHIGKKLVTVLNSNVIHAATIAGEIKGGKLQYKDLDSLENAKKLVEGVLNKPQFWNRIERQSFTFELPPAWELSDGVEDRKSGLFTFSSTEYLISVSIWLDPKDRSKPPLQLSKTLEMLENYGAKVLDSKVSDSKRHSAVQTIVYYDEHTSKYRIIEVIHNGEYSALIGLTASNQDEISEMNHLSDYLVWN
jgi:hypothetical protein